MSYAPWRGQHTALWPCPTDLFSCLVSWGGLHGLSAGSWLSPWPCLLEPSSSPSVSWVSSTPSFLLSHRPAAHTVRLSSAHWCSRRYQLYMCEGLCLSGSCRFQSSEFLQHPVCVPDSGGPCVLLGVSHSRSPVGTWQEGGAFCDPLTLGGPGSHQSRPSCSVSRLPPGGLGGGGLQLALALEPLLETARPP